MKAAKIAAAAALALMQAGVAGSAGAQTPPPPMTERPPQNQCQAVADVDLRAMARRAEHDRAEADRLAAEQGRPTPDQSAIGMLEPVRIADWAARKPPADAVVVIRARMPPGGGYPSDHRAVVWREADGSWWFWRHSVNEGPPAMPPLPPGFDSSWTSERLNAWTAEQLAGRTSDEINWPPKEGRLAANRAAQLEAAWRDPCRGWDPDYWPHEIPLNRRIDGSRTRLCAQDSSAVWGEIAENGAPPRRVGGACINASPTYRMIESAAYARGDEPA